MLNDRQRELMEMDAIELVRLAGDMDVYEHGMSHEEMVAKILEKEAELAERTREDHE